MLLHATKLQQPLRGGPSGTIAARGKNVVGIRESQVVAGTAYVYAVHPPPTQTGIQSTENFTVYTYAKQTHIAFFKDSRFML